MEISKIVLKLADDHSLELTIDQAKELQKLLNITFDIKQNETIVRPYFIPQYPVNPWWNPTIITCDTNNSIKEESYISFNLKSELTC